MDKRLPNWTKVPSPGSPKNSPSISFSEIDHERPQMYNRQKIDIRTILAEREASPDSEDEDYNQADASELPDDAIGEAIIENTARPVTQKEIIATTTIQHAFRQYLRNRPKRESFRKKAKEDYFFLRCLSIFSSKVDLPDNYRRVCLWRLPILLTLLETMSHALPELKRDMRKWWSNAENVEIADRGLKAIGRALKLHKEVKQALDLYSPALLRGELFHIEEQTRKLRKILEEVDAYIKGDKIDKMRSQLNSGVRRLGRYMDTTN